MSSRHDSGSPYDSECSRFPNEVRVLIYAWMTATAQVLLSSWLPCCQGTAQQQQQQQQQQQEESDAGDDDAGSEQTPIAQQDNGEGSPRAMRRTNTYSMAQWSDSALGSPSSAVKGKGNGTASSGRGLLLGLLLFVLFALFSCLLCVPNRTTWIYRSTLAFHAHVLRLDNARSHIIGLLETMHD